MNNKRQRIEDTDTKQLPYSQCSKSQQSRRRAQLVSTLQQLSGISDNGEQLEAECVALLRDTASRNPLLAPLQNDHKPSDDLLQQLIQNIKDRHDSLPDEKRTETLALVANVFSRKDLKDKYKFYFGNRQIQAAKQMATDRQFVVEPDEHFTPRIRLPKTAQFVDKIEEFLNSNSAPSSSLTEITSGKRVLTKALRALHREFIQLSSANRISFSAFRAIALEKFTFPGQKEPEEPLPSTSGNINISQAASALNFRPIRPLLSASPSAISSSSNKGGMTVDAIVNQSAINPIVSTQANGFTSQPLSSILQLPIPSSTQSSMPIFGQATNSLVSENPQQILNAINLSILGVNNPPTSTSQAQQQQQQQPGNNMLSNLVLPSLDFTASRDNMYNSNPFQAMQPLTSIPNVSSQQTMNMFDSEDPFLTNNNSASMLLDNVGNSQMGEIPNINSLFSLMESLGGTQEVDNTVNSNNQPTSSSSQQLPSDFFSFE